MDSFHSLKQFDRRLLLRRVMLTVAILMLVVLPLVFFAFRRFERAVTFHPELYDGGATWEPRRGADDVWFKTPSGVRLHGWFVRAGGDAATATVLYFHGNGGNLSRVGWLADELAARGFDVMLFDYKGYGRSEGASGSEQSLFEDADAAYDYLTKERGVAPESLVLYGQSLGTTAATDVAARRPCAALILESGLSSASDMASVVLPGSPRFLHRLGRNRFESARKLARVGCPVLVAHGERDEVIPVAQGRALYAAAHEPKSLIVIPQAGHNNLVATGGEAYLRALVEFIRAGSTTSR